MASQDNRDLLVTGKESTNLPHAERERARIRADLAAGRRSLFKVAPVGPAQSTVMLDVRLAEELDFVVRQLRQVSDLLMNNPSFAHYYTDQLQSLASAQQVLTNLGRIVAAADKQTATDATSLSELRLRLTREPLSPQN